MLNIDRFNYASNDDARAAWFASDVLALGSVRSDGSGCAAGYIYYGKFPALLTTSINNIHVYSINSSNVRVGIYTDVDGVAGLLICESASIACIGGQQNKIPIPVTAIIEGVNYHVGIQCDVTGGVAYWATAFGGYQAHAYNAFPATAAEESQSTAPDIAGYYSAIDVFSESSIKKEGAYSLKLTAPSTISLDQTVTRVLVPGWNLSGQQSLNIWVRASRTGSNFKIGFHDSGGTIIELTPNILLSNTWQLASLDISGVAEADKDAINQIILTILNADADNDIYLDNLYADDGGTGTGGGGISRSRILGGC